MPNHGIRIAIPADRTNRIKFRPPGCPGNQTILQEETERIETELVFSVASLASCKIRCPVWMISIFVPFLPRRDADAFKGV